MANLPERHGADLGDVSSAEANGQRLRTKTLSFARVARSRHEKPSEFVVTDGAFAVVGIVVFGLLGAGIGERRPERAIV